MNGAVSKAAVVLGAAALLSGAGAGTATAAGRPSERPAATDGKAVTAGRAAATHCAYVLDRMRPGETSSRVLRQGCAPSEKEARGAVGAAADTLLLVMYADANYGGLTKSWYGKYGPCDTEGYGIRNLETTFWNINDKISSWSAGHHSCNYVNMWEDAVYQGRHAAWHNYSRVPYVGSAMNDRVSSVNVHYEP
ncbi:hypothetical protein [Actinomadura latina]|uniref:Peptidase inhibitor family I36 protein n=1 Tax=Actinomadura latina TaxID=163603 RepID=A0A846YVL6_9ACTN|nr:hypothetical protein [Actinomadura latina]NKZ03767.1 hypothetical protein [Actinomadura latina]